MITLESSDKDLIGQTSLYVITVEFALFPQASNPDAPSVPAMSTVEFIDPCISPFTFASTSQTSPGSDKYTNSQIVFNLNPFTITPSICEVQYVCTSVIRVDDVNAASDITCSDLTFDGIMNGDLSDGQLTFSAD